MYQPGGFHEPHVDRSRQDELQITPVRRRVPVVVFLNATRTPPGPGDYPLVHEVPPVTAGDRYTIVDWFTE